ncbi:hypothetical protein KKI24_14820 [bacterium]|nr:hypothetical protein [bacterium]
MRPIFRKQHGLSIKVTSILLLLVPIINISFLMASNQEGILGVSGEMTPAGVALFAGITGVIIVAAFLYGRSRILFRILVSAVCIVIPIVFTVIDPRNYVLQTVIIATSLFFLLYFIYYERAIEDHGKEVTRALILHNLMLLFVIVISTKFSLLNIAWNRYSILVYLMIYIGFTLYDENSDRDIKNRKRYTGILIGAVLITTTYFVFEELNFLLTFFYLVFLLYFQLHDLKFDRFLIDLLFENPYKLLISSFALIVFLGSLLLSMPFSDSGGIGITYSDSLFTATSAVCVTGLVVLDTYRDFSIIGQGIILALIQIGGLGIVTIMTFVSILLGQTIGISKEYVVGEIVGSGRPKLVYDLIKFVVLTTLIVEAVGSVILTIAFQLQEKNWLLSIWKGVFHAVSAFCNAGFALQSDNLAAYNQTYWIPLTICCLIITGGLGFPVISLLFDSLTRKTESKRTPILVSVSLLTTAGLLISGYLLFLVGEYNGSLAGLTASQKHLNAFFLSVTARTAGFNTIDMNLLSGSSILILWVLMFIGAGSCSTAGGIKVTTLGVLLATIVSFIKGRSETILFKKRLPSLLVKRSIVLFLTSVSLIFFIAILLQLSQKLSLSETMFETISAFGTVGLSLGATSKLDDFGKFLIVIVMFIGRVNILTFISLFVATRESSVQYPEESLMIG